MPRRWIGGWTSRWCARLVVVLGEPGPPLFSGTCPGSLPDRSAERRRSDCSAGLQVADLAVPPLQESGLQPAARRATARRVERGGHPVRGSSTGTRDRRLRRLHRPGSCRLTRPPTTGAGPSSGHHRSVPLSASVQVSWPPLFRSTCPLTRGGSSDSHAHLVTGPDDLRRDWLITTRDAAWDRGRASPLRRRQGSRVSKLTPVASGSSAARDGGKMMALPA